MRVTLYVPCYDGAAWLGECLASLLDQTAPFDEALVIDDGSQDASARIARAFGPPVRVVAHPRNLGLAVARNTALREATGDVVASVDADVRVERTWLARLLEGFDSPRTAAVGGKLTEARQDHLADRWRAAHMAQHAGDFPQVDPPALAGANVAVRREVVRALGGYDESFRTNYEDADLQQRLRAAGYFCRYEPAAQAFHLRTDTARTVLRTYWNWLRPPFERQGAFTSDDGLAQKQRATIAFAREALWQDFSGHRPELAYLSLLVLLLFPAADWAHAARRAPADARAARLTTLAGAWLRELPSLVRLRSAALARCMDTDVRWLAWWTVGAPADGSAAASTTIADDPPFVAAGAAAARALRAFPRPWWPAIEAAREALAQDEQWAAVPIPPAVEVTGALPPAPSLPAPDDGPRTPDLGPKVAAWLRRRVPGLLAIIGHGAHFRDEAVAFLPGAPLECALVLRVLPPAARVQQWQAGLRAHLRIERLDLQALEAHRVGWLPPSPLQQSLLAGGVLLWGDAAALAAVPSWRPDQLDPLLALAEMAQAETDLAAGFGALAAQRAAGALLLARRSYTPRFDERPAALRRAWPEAPPLADTPPRRFVARAAALLPDWLFTWEGAGPGPDVIRRFAQIRAAQRVAEGAW